MDIEGTYTLQASVEDVWRSLMDHRILHQAFPNIEMLEQTDPSIFLLTLRIKYAPLMGLYQGRITLSGQHYPSRFQVQGEAVGSQGTVQGSGTIQLRQHEENTIITYKGTANLGKLAALLPRSVFKGAMKLFAQHYFAALSEQLRALGLSPRPLILEHDAMNIHAERGSFLVQAAQEVETQPHQPLSQTIARVLGLGGGDLSQEERWASRVRGAGIVSGLLFLIWIGTRIPGRR